MTDPRCLSCGAWPEMVRGAWWPHAPGAPCRPPDLAEALLRVAEAAFDMDTSKERGITECTGGLHIHPAGSSRCKCGQSTIQDDWHPVPDWWMER